MPETKRVHLPIIQKGNDLAKLEPLALPSAPYVQDGVPALSLKSSDLASRTELRTSSYTIYVDLPGHTDEMLLVHGYTGAYDRVSKQVATYLRSREARHAPKPLYGDWTPEPSIDGEVVAPAAETLATLKKRGYLVPLTPEEEEALFVKVASRFHHAAVHRAPSYVIMPTYQCNLRCPYCFQDHMRTDPSYSHLLRVIDRDMADRILRGMDQIDAVHGVPEDDENGRRILFFGGEPLLASSRPMIEYMMNRLRERGRARFSAITNATELDAYRDLLGKDLIGQLQITVDGPPEIHDQRRIYADGSGSFARIADNIDMALERGVLVNVRMNIDRQNITDLPRLADLYSERGWTGQTNFGAYVAPIHPNDHTDAKTTFNSWQLSRALEELKDQFPQLESISLVDDMLEQQAGRILGGGGEAGPSFRTAFCGAHSSMYVIDAFADIYACWERTGDPEVRIGHIAESGEVLMNSALARRWRARNVVSNPVCRKCRYATSCGGGCAVLAEETSGDAYKNHCDGFAKRFRLSVGEAYLAYLRGEQKDIDINRLCDA